MAKLDPAWVERANAIYAEVRFEPSSPSDETYGVVENDELIALGRACYHADGAVEIGGFWTHPGHRRRGLARAVVAHVLDSVAAGTRVWCVPFDHLVAFYASFGLAPVADGTPAPPSILAKLESCGSAFADPNGPRASSFLSMTK